MYPPTSAAAASADVDSIVVFRPWSSDALTMAGVLYGTVVTVAGVLLAPLRWPGNLLYVLGVALGFFVFFFLLRSQTVLWMRRYIDWKGWWTQKEGSLGGAVKPSGAVKTKVIRDGSRQSPT